MGRYKSPEVPDVKQTRVRKRGGIYRWMQRPKGQGGDSFHYLMVSPIPLFFRDFFICAL